MLAPGGYVPKPTTGSLRFYSESAGSKWCQKGERWRWGGIHRCRDMEGLFCWPALASRIVYLSGRTVWSRVI